MARRAAAGVAVLLALGAVFPNAQPSTAATHEPFKGIRVEGAHLVDDAGNPVTLQGVNRMGTEYACISQDGWGIFDGPSDPASNASTLRAMATWKVNAVRVPLNEQCWLDRETEGLNRNYLGENYQAAIRGWVGQITGSGMVAIVDLHWSAPKGHRATGQQPMADTDNALDFWRSAAATFKDNPLVIFDVFNEPYLERDDPPPADPWNCWRDGCTVFLHEGDNQGQTTQRYQAAGMQQLVDAVRSTGAGNPIMLGGLSYAADLDGLVAHLPSDPHRQLIAAWHPYADSYPCSLERPDCWDGAIAPVMKTMPVVAGEFGREDCETGALDRFMDWMDLKGGSYLAWVWTIASDKKCPKDKYDLIVDYDTGAASSPYGAAVRAHYTK